MGRLSTLISLQVAGKTSIGIYRAQELKSRDR